MDVIPCHDNAVATAFPKPLPTQVVSSILRYTGYTGYTVTLAAPVTPDTAVTPLHRLHHYTDYTIKLVTPLR